VDGNTFVLWALFIIFGLPYVAVAFFGLIAGVAAMVMGKSGLKVNK
jgi:hypothetical protein